MVDETRRHTIQNFAGLRSQIQHPERIGPRVFEAQFVGGRPGIALAVGREARRRITGALQNALPQRARRQTVGIDIVQSNASRLAWHPFQKSDELRARHLKFGFEIHGGRNCVFRAYAENGLNERPIPATYSNTQSRQRQTHAPSEAEAREIVVECHGAAYQTSWKSDEKAAFRFGKRPFLRKWGV